MQRKDKPELRMIQATVMDILLNDILHIAVEETPLFNKPYTILLDDSQFQSERYALFTADKLNIIEFLFPKTPSELSAAATNDQIQL